MAWFNNSGGFSPFMQQPQMMQPMQQGGFGGMGDFAEQIRRRQQQQQQQMQQSFGGFRQMGGFGGFSPPMGGFGGFGGGGPMMGGPQRGGWVQELLSGLNQGQGPMAPGQGGMSGGLLGGGVTDFAGPSFGPAGIGGLTFGPGGYASNVEGDYQGLPNNLTQNQYSSLIENGVNPNDPNAMLTANGMSVGEYGAQNQSYTPMPKPQVSSISQPQVLQSQSLSQQPQQQAQPYSPFSPTGWSGLTSMVRSSANSR